MYKTGRIILFLLLIVLVGCDKKEKRPNIIFLLSDDQRWDALGAAGNSIIQTPNLDQIARDGVMFKNAFVTTSICCSSRASILTGQYVSRNGVVDFKKELTEQQFANTYPIHLKNNGYQIGFVGKYGVGHSKLEREKKAFDYFWGESRQPKYENINGSGDTIHYTELVQRHVLEFLESTSNSKPFCLSVSFKAPHVEDGDPRQFIYNPKYKNLYKEDAIPVSDVAMDNYDEKFPDFFRNTPNNKPNEARKRWELRFSTPEKYQESVKGYYRLVTGIDDVVGKMRSKLEEKGLSKNTVIIYMGDNGFYLGEHGLAGKWYGHEPSIRVPLLVYDPRLKKQQRGKVHEQMALNIDVAPTILNLAGIEPDANMQGKSLTDIYMEGTDEWREQFYYEHLLPFSVIPRSQGIRTKKYKYLYYPDSPQGYEEVYDLENDPNEMINLAVYGIDNEVLGSLRNGFKELQIKVK